MTEFPVEALVARLRDDGIASPRFRMLAWRTGRVVFQVSTRTLKVVVRLSTDLTRLQAEVAATIAAHSLDLGPEPSAIKEVSAKWHYFVEQHLGGRVWKPWLESDNYTLVAELAERLHCFQNLIRDDERLRHIQPTLARARAWVQNGEGFGLRPPRTLISALERLEAPDIEPKFGLIHGDLRAKNMVLNEGRLKLVDFEHAGRGDILFDLTKLSLSRGISEEQFNNYLLHSYGRADARILEVVSLYREVHKFAVKVWRCRHLNNAASQSTIVS